jgi:hypothetical protein
VLQHALTLRLPLSLLLSRKPALSSHSKKKSPCQKLPEPTRTYQNLPEPTRTTEATHLVRQYDLTLCLLFGLLLSRSQVPASFHHCQHHHCVAATAVGVEMREGKGPAQAYECTHAHSYALRRGKNPA